MLFVPFMALAQQPALPSCSISEATNNMGCFDGVDNDGNGSMDSMDPACSQTLAIDLNSYNICYLEDDFTIEVSITVTGAMSCLMSNSRFRQPIDDTTDNTIFGFLFRDLTNFGNNLWVVYLQLFDPINMSNELTASQITMAGSQFTCISGTAFVNETVPFQPFTILPCD